MPDITPPIEPITEYTTNTSYTDRFTEFEIDISDDDTPHCNDNITYTHAEVVVLVVSTIIITAATTVALLILTK